MLITLLSEMKIISFHLFMKEKIILLAAKISILLITIIFVRVYMEEQQMLTLF